ncbi:PAS domain-containing protein [Runella slithyformis]|uniref:PAS sensor protein n=1 Tax=Runella slithyformis (strain ATCC 29530 / DSM 19594 / LMG 11500 / NCIMB 11436 / LSU 4) TaxID=761193 RepID=A0A7U3ZL83_RUNSL|nr:PAS domain-containing protein [Runella slithyformis]AEI49272.1 PAS sensor protein [Runella slithyformis DSM 19594]
MFSTSAFANMIRQSYVQTEGDAPLFCWDIIQLNRATTTNTQQDFYGLKTIMATRQWSLNLNFRELLQNHYTIVITDPRQAIQWVSSSFQKMTGYSKLEAIGQKPSFLQGKNTDPQQLIYLREQLSAGLKTQTEIVNYRKNGEEYLCWIEALPVLNRKGELVNYLAIEKEVKQLG